MGAPAQQEPAIDPSLDISIASSKDGSRQPLIFYLPPGAEATARGPKVPLVVFLHSWSSDYKTDGLALEETKRRGWIFAGPNFRGPNETPQACASDLAVQDILDSVDYARSKARVDEKRVYLVGSSGGGQMALLMATRAPQVWSAVSTWVPITDLASWHEFSKATGSQYFQMMDKCLGGPPEEYAMKRDPLRDIVRSEIWHYAAGTTRTVATTPKVGEYVVVTYLKLAPGKQADYLDIWKKYSLPLQEERVKDGKIKAYSMWTVGGGGTASNYDMVTLARYAAFNDIQPESGATSETNAYSERVHAGKDWRQMQRDMVALRSVYRSEIVKIQDRIQ